MNRQQLHTALAQATTSTFEELALLVVVAAEALTPDAPAADAPDAHATGVVRPPPCGVRVDFAGPWGGSIVVRVAEAVLDAAAANMLGIAAAPDAPARRDALGELANVICGNLLPAVAGRAAVFVLQAPRWIGRGEAPCAPADTRLTCRVTLDEGVVEVEVHVPAHLVASIAPGGLVHA